MERENKAFYETPATTVVALNQETMVCTSPQGAKTQDYYYGSLDED